MRIELSKICEYKEKERMKEEKIEPKKLLCPKAGTATSSPAIKTPSPAIKNLIRW